MPDVKLRSCRTGGSAFINSSVTCCRRKGYGAEKWINEEQKYEGRLSTNAFHGEGLCEWLTGKEKLLINDHFHSNFKEGYGLVSFPDGSLFEGLFCDNQPFGPGILTYGNGRQDVGFWCGERLVRLSRAVDYIIPRLASTSAGKLKLLQFRTTVPILEEEADVAAALLIKHDLDPSQSSRLYSNLIHDPRSAFFNRLRSDKSTFDEVNPNSPCQTKENILHEAGTPCNLDGLADHHRPCRQSSDSSIVITTPLKEIEGESTVGVLRFYAAHGTLEGYPVDFPGEKEEDNYVADPLPKSNGSNTEIECEQTRLLTWSRNELCLEMLKQIFRFHSFEDKLTFKISDLISGNRTKFRKTGEKERLALHFLKMCSIGPAYIVKDLLCSGNISEALMDARGNNSIMFAAATDQHDVIDLLLDYGVDVNSFNDENLNPLNLCILRRIAEVASVGNWEVSFLAPDPLVPAVEGVKAESCEMVESNASLDRIFGDGMSVEEKEAFHDFTEDHIHKDSVYYLDAKVSQNSSDVTILEGNRNEKNCNPFCQKSNLSLLPGNANETVEIGSGMCPRSFKREEYLRSVAPPTKEDKYLFELNPKIEENDSIDSSSQFFQLEHSKPFNEERFGKISERICNVDRTIEQLMSRGADPNLGYVPKPALHLAVHSRALKLVRLLLAYGAAPDSQTLREEGLLTPLHVIVLMKPEAVQIDMCKLLLRYGANPQKETAPDFRPFGEKDFLFDPEHGRTPLQLLCTRRDAKFADPEGFLSQLALILVRVSKRNHFFSGHSYLTLAMISGNYKLVELLLHAKRVHPNQILKKDLGTALHVLVSTELQRRTLFEDSIWMCDLLLEHGANPNLKFHSPHFLAGTCIDYGYREIERERKGDRRSKSEILKSYGRNYLEDHLRVVEYLRERANYKNEGVRIGQDRRLVEKGHHKGMRETKTTGEGIVERRDEEAPDPIRIDISEMSERTGGIFREAGRGNTIERGGSKRSRELVGGTAKEAGRGNTVERGGGGKSSRELVGGTVKETGQGNVREKGGGEKRLRKVAALTSGEKGEGGGKRAREGAGGVAMEAEREGKGNVHDQTNDESKTTGFKKHFEKARMHKPEGGKDFEKSKENKEGKRKGNEGKGRNREEIGRRNALNVKSKLKESERIEQIPKSFYNSLFYMFGICGERLDLNDFLSPYVVLRNGDFYYRFNGRKPGLTEQYSLI